MNIFQKCIDKLRQLLFGEPLPLSAGEAPSYSPYRPWEASKPDNTLTALPEAPSPSSGPLTGNIEDAQLVRVPDSVVTPAADIGNVLYRQVPTPEPPSAATPVSSASEEKSERNPL